ncbi:MAG: hypothetical protein AAF703_03620 [Cyanobacteria bacterium P01_D01_bin.105]
MADLIIPAALRLWLIFLIAFALLGYSVPFSIAFGAIGGLAGGISFAWWQIKGGAPSRRSSAGSGSTDQDQPTPSKGPESNSRWALPLFKPDKAKVRYLERKRRIRDRKMR